MKSSVEMKISSVLKTSLALCLCFVSYSQAVFREDATVLVSLLVRNKAHTLPYFLKLFEEMDYPKYRMALWIQTENNQDDSLEILQKWTASVEKSYHKIYKEFVPSDKDGPIQTNWTAERFTHYIKLKEEALQKGREMWADYVWFLDSDALLTNNQTLKSMVSTNYPVVAPMLETQSMYSNYWCGMGDDFYYKRTEAYKPIRNREDLGCHRVILVHSCFLIDLRQSESLFLTFEPEKINGYNGPTDDIITLAISAFWNNVDVYVCNHEKYGFLTTPLEESQTMKDDYAQLLNLKVEASVDFPPMEPHPLLTEFVTDSPKSTVGFDEVFLINLKRRPERLVRMEYSLGLLGIQHKLIDAVDGKDLNDTLVEALGIKMLPNYADPYHHRAMTMGEIGCFLSHYNIWKEIVERKLERSLIFEDDIRFEPYFQQKLSNFMHDVDKLKVDWDIIYLGRKRLALANESFVDGSDFLVNVEYSYWTLSYILSQKGAEKLINGEPLKKLVPVDEYLPIMFDHHPESRWKDSFPNRDLKAFSIHPLLVYPTHYVKDEGYISDTESSEIVPENVRSHPENGKAGKGSKEKTIEEMQAELLKPPKCAMTTTTAKPKTVNPLEFRNEL